MQSHDEFRQDFVTLKDKVDDLVQVMPRPRNIQEKKEEIARLKAEIKKRVGTLQTYLCGSNGKSGPIRVESKEEYECQVMRWNQLLDILEDHAKECDKKPL